MQLTWFGHSCFLVNIGSASVLFDPFLTGNPTFEALGRPVAEVTEGVTHIALTHGHDDHVGDTVAIAEATGATIIANFELCQYLASKGAEKAEFMNPGGTVDLGAFQMTMVNAHHSSSTFADGINHYLGVAAGLIMVAPGLPTVYHMGDTSVISEFAIINDLYAPKIGIVPIGDRFTMGAKSAAYACKKFFQFDMVVPCHYGTFPIIDPTPDKFIAEMSGQNVRVPGVGEAIDL